MRDVVPKKDVGWVHILTVYISDDLLGFLFSPFFAGENNQWTISTAAGAGVLLLLIIVTLAITGVTCYRKWKRRNGYIIIPGENVEQPVLEPQFDSLERDGPVKGNKLA